MRDAPGPRRCQWRSYSLAEQDRSLWDRELIAEGISLLADAVGKGAVGEYQLQAAIAAEHAQAASTEDTDWREILGLYGLLERMTGNPMVSLNRAIAAAMVDGPDAGLALLEKMDEQLDDHYRLHAAGPTCWKWPEIQTGRSLSIGLQPAAPTASPSSTT